MKKYLIILFVFTLLFITRFIDFMIVWHLGNHEIGYLNTLMGIDTKNIQYTFIGFSSYRNAKEKLSQEICNRKKDVIVVSYYNLINPSSFLIYNMGNERMVLLPWMPVTVGKGITVINIFKFDLAKVIINDRTEYRIVEVGGSFLPILEKILTNENDFLHHESFFNSFKYVNKIHAIYFFFPLALIMFFSFFYSKSIFISFYYFFFMLFLFQTSAYWNCPICLAQLFSGIKLRGIFSFFLIVNWITYYLFYKGIKYGKKLIKEKGLNYKEKIVVWYIMLLPLFFRF